MNQNIREQQDMGTGSVPALRAKLAVPVVVAQLISLLYNIIDRIYIGHIIFLGPALSHLVLRLLWEKKITGALKRYLPIALQFY